MRIVCLQIHPRASDTNEKFRLRIIIRFEFIVLPATEFICKQRLYLGVKSFSWSKAY